MHSLRVGGNVNFLHKYIARGWREKVNKITLFNGVKDS